MAGRRAPAPPRLIVVAEYAPDRDAMVRALLLVLTYTPLAREAAGDR
jgi:hypothetical protein